MPSHLSNDAGRARRRAWRSKGMITVGPVTTMMAPKTHATGHDNPPAKWASIEPSVKLTTSPTPIKRPTAEPARPSS